jgi:hypothetical protein
LSRANHLPFLHDWVVTRIPNYGRNGVFYASAASGDPESPRDNFLRNIKAEKTFHVVLATESILALSDTLKTGIIAGVDTAADTTPVAGPPRQRPTRVGGAWPQANHVRKRLLGFPWFARRIGAGPVYSSLMDELTALPSAPVESCR